MIKLNRIEIVKPLKYKQVSKKYYKLTSDFNVRLHTSEGILDAYMKARLDNGFAIWNRCYKLVYSKKR
jgi:hypothetical protein